jgi:hypothetical protein
VAGGFTLDLDRTIFAREGSQEGAAKDYPPPRCPGRKSHHPLLAMHEEHAVPYIIVAHMTTALNARLHSLALVWRDLGKGYAVSSFTLRLHGWSDTRRFVVVRELGREDKSAAGRQLIDVPGYTFRVWVTNRTEDSATLWRDYNSTAGCGTARPVVWEDGVATSPPTRFSDGCGRQVRV